MTEIRLKEIDTMRPVVAVVFCLLLAARPASARDLIALTGQLTAENHQYGELGVPRINNSGEVAFSAGLKVSRTSPALQWSIWKVGNGASRIAMEQQLIAGDTYFGRNSDDLDLDNLVLADTGQVAFRSSFTNSSEMVSGFGIVVADEQQTSIVVRGGGAAPGGGTINNFSAPVFSNDGQLAFRGRSSGTSTSESTDAIWAGPTGVGQLQVVAREGATAPGTGSTFARFTTDLRVGSGGKVAFKAELPKGQHEYSGWIADGTGLTKIFETHAETAPGTTVQFGTGFSGATNDMPISVNGQGQVSFLHTLTGPDVTSGNSTGIWSGPAENIDLTARQGQSAGLGAYVSGLPNVPPIMGAGGHVLLRAGYADSTLPVGEQRVTGLWLGKPGELDVIMREGELVPEVGPGVTVLSVGFGTLNEYGETVFTASLTGTGINTSNNDTLWGLDRTGSMHLLAREGELVDVDPTTGIDKRIIQAIHVLTGSGGDDGLARSINNAGLVTFALDFTDGSRGLFVQQVPEPSTCLLAGLGMLGVFVFSRRRKPVNVIPNP